MNETMVETCVLTLGELMSGNVNNDKLLQCKKMAEHFSDKKYQLTIPFYQRPYVWSEDMIKIMLEDIDEQRKDGKKYLLGSLIIHIDCGKNENKDENTASKTNKENENFVKFNIVDGQQRLTTLDLVLQFFEKNLGLTEEQRISSETDIKNKATQTIKNWFENKNQDGFLKYLIENIEFVCVFTNSLDDAFIFFDSANAKGKRLEGYDLIKAYHLRALEDTNKDKIPYYARFFENLASKQDDLNVLINLVLKPAREWIINRQNRQDESIEEIMKIYNEFCKEIPQRFRKDEPYSTQNSLGILQNFIGGADFFEYLKNFDTHYKRMKDFSLYAKLNDLKDKGGFDYALKLYLMSSIIYFDKFSNGRADYMLRLIARAVFSVRISNKILKYTTTKEYGKKLLHLIYYASYEQELEYKLNDFIETEIANEKEKKSEYLFKKEVEYLDIMQVEYKKYGIVAHISKNTQNKGE